MGEKRYMPRGFIWGGKFHENRGNGHEASARLLIDQYKEEHPNEDWNWFPHKSAKDFLVMQKKAIQIGCGSEPTCAIASGYYYTREDVKKILEKFKFGDYKIYIFWY